MRHIDRRRTRRAGSEDIAQQVFLEAYTNLDSLKDPAKLGGWLRTISVRKSVNAIRASRNEVAIQQDGSDGLLIGDANEDLEREDLKRRVGKAIGSLRETQRETTTLFSGCFQGAEAEGICSAGS